MSLELRWMTGISVSSLHAASVVAGGQQLVDPQLQALLNVPLQELSATLLLVGESRQRLLAHLAALSGGIENNSELAELALVKTLGQGKFASDLRQRLSMNIGQLEQTLLRAKPGLLDELALRGEPLRQQWEARGPGVWRYLQQRTEANLLVERADVYLVLPASGGGGAAHWQYNSVRIEAVLANPYAELPEVLRLAWLLAQLQLDLPMYQEAFPIERWELVAPLAMIPAVLAAGEEVELARNDAQTLALAVQHWTGVDGTVARQHATALAAWWETYRNARPRFAVALAALSEML